MGSAIADTDSGVALPLTFGEFVLERRLGRGGMGEVDLARHPSRGEGVVAVKLQLDGAQGGAARLASEARLAASIDHPNVVRVHGSGVVDGVPWLSMEYVAGQDLEEALRHTPSLPWEPALAIGDAIAAALDAAHAQGVVHRDLKPSNVRLTGDGQVRVMDFGIAARTATSGGPILGTPAYLAPEVARGDPVDGRADLYSLGVVLFRLLTGHLPFAADDQVELVHLQLTAEPPRVAELAPGVPPAVDRLVDRLLAKDPAARPASADALRAELAAARRAGLGPLRRLGRAVRGLFGAAAPPPPGAAFPAPPDAPPPARRREMLASSGEYPRALDEEERARLLALLRGLVPPGPREADPPASPTDALFLVRVKERVDAGRFKLPLLPRATLDVLALLGDARASIKDAALLVAGDPVLAGQVLRVANGAASAAARTNDPTLAVVRLGQRPLRALLLEVMASAVLVRGALVGPLARRLWAHSIGCGVLARRLAEAAGEEPQECYVAGLLHDVGMVPLLDIIDEVARALAIRPSEGAILLALERHHEEVGGRVLEAWSLPDLAAAATSHHAAAPSPAGRRGARLAAIVAVADALCDAPSLEALPPEQLAVCGREPVERVLASLDEALAEVERRLNV